MLMKHSYRLACRKQRYLKIVILTTPEQLLYLFIFIVQLKPSFIKNKGLKFNR